LSAVAQLSEWLQLMLAEIARKREEARRAVEEQQARAAVRTPEPPHGTQSS
jgi:hypothetical protein